MLVFISAPLGKNYNTNIVHHIGYASKKEAVLIMLIAEPVVL
jgi:hypothetical protein